jgi:hypothetical protein
LADVVHIPYAVATGSANAYSVTIPGVTSYQEGLAIAVKINADNTGPSTINVNGLGAVAIKKPNGLDVAAGNLKTNSIYTLRYNGVNFILQGEGGSGTAQPADVLSGKTFTNDQGEQTGTMPNRGSPTLQPGQSISAGYYSGGSVAYPPHGLQEFTASDSFTVPAGVNQIVVFVCGGGGGGGSGYGYTSGGNGGGGGGAGACAIARVTVTPGQVLTVTVGAGGAGGPQVPRGAVGQSGSPGGASSVTGTNVNVVGGGGAGGTNASYSYTIGYGGSVGSATGATYVVGTKGEAGDLEERGGDGGTSFFGVGGSGGDEASGGNAANYGAGGGGGGAYDIGYAGGAGAQGKVIIMW